MTIDSRARERHLGFPMRFLCLAILLCASPALAQSAPPSRPISLREAVAMAVKQNRVIRSADADIEIAEGNELNAIGLIDNEIDAKASWTRNRASIIPGAAFQQPAQDTLHTEASFVQPTSYGGRFGLRVSHDYTRTTTTLLFGTMSVDTSTIAFSPTVQLTYVQPLLRNFGSDAYLGQKRIFAAGTDAATADMVNVASGVIRDTIQAYWELAYQDKELDIRRSALNLAREQLRVTQARLDVGVGAPTDLAEVRATIATREDDLLLSELTLSERALDVRQISGMPITPTEILLTPTDQAAPQLFDVSIEQALKAANEANPQIIAVRAHGRQARIVVEVDENGLLPQLDLNVAAGPLGYADNFGDSMSQLVHFDNYAVTAGLTLAAPIQRRVAKGLIGAARGQLHKTEISEEDLRAQVAVAVARAVDLVKQTQKRLDVEAEAIQLGQVNLDAERARFDVGRSTNFDVLRRQDELSQAQLRRIRASADYMKAVAVLQTLTGELLPAYGITIKPKR